MTIATAWSEKPNPPIRVQRSMGTFLLLSKSSATFGLYASEVVLLAFGVLLVVALVGERRNPWWRPQFSTFELLVIIGVAGELFGDAGVFIFSSQLQTIADAELTAVIMDVGNTRTAANKAAGAAARAEDSAEQANSKAENISKQAIELQTALAKLRRSTGPRFLSPDEQQRLAEVLSKYKVKRITIYSKTDDLEAVRFGDDFLSVFTKAGWPKSDRGSFGPRSATFINQAGQPVQLPPPGITIPVENEANPPAVVNALAKTLRKLGFPAQVITNHYDDDWLHIWIGPK